MQIMLIAVGSRGDVQPYVALGKGAGAIDRVVIDPLIRQPAAELGAKIQAEDGVGSVVKIVRSIDKSSTSDRKINNAR